MTDRRVQRTRELLRRALLELIDEKGYDAVTIQDITERANVGRTTFYLHYQGKDDLMVDHHVNANYQFSIGILSREDILGETPEAPLLDFLNLLAKDRLMYFSITKAKDSHLIMRTIRQQLAQNLSASLKGAFPDSEPRIPLAALVQYLVNAQIAFIDWWMNEQFNVYSPQEIALMLHQQQRALIKANYLS